MTAESVAQWCRDMPPEDVCDHPGCHAVATVLVTGTWRIGQFGTEVELGRYCPLHADSHREVTP